MTIKSTISVNLVKSGETTVDLASITQGVSIRQRLEVGKVGRHTATITLWNNDGALTPGAGGTYSNVDWFSRAIQIDGDTGTYTFNLCHGIITGFDLVDNGTESYVQLQIDDVFTCGGNADVTITSGSSPIGAQIKSWIEGIMNGTIVSGGSFNRVRLPELGSVFGRAVEATSVGIRNQSLYFFPDPDPYEVVANDFLNQSLAIAGPNVIWPTVIDMTESVYVYQAAYCAMHPLRSSGTAITFTFDENASTGELPMSRVQRGYNIDGLINTANFKALDDGATTQPHEATAANTDSQRAHGQRGMSAQAVLEGKLSSGVDATLEAITSRWANQYSKPEFVIETIETDEALINANVGSSATSEQKWAQLLDVTTGTCQIAEVNFTPTGASSQQTEYVILLGRSIDITPSNLRVRLECMPLAQSGAFILDSSTLGVLDQNRLG